MFELSEFELSGINYYKKYCQIQGELDLVRVNEEFELSEFELAGDYCISIKVVPEQSGKVEYEREKLAGSDD